MKRPTMLTAPFLKRITLLEDKADKTVFPFNRLDWLNQPEFSLNFPSRVTFFVGENGSGKSTLLEAIAALCGFPVGGGSQDHQREADEPESRLAQALRPQWLPRVRTGFYLRAESFFSMAGYLDEEGGIERSGGQRLHEQSHGESVMALLANRISEIGRGVILMDEPEAALSPSRQLAFLALLHEWDLSKNIQVIIATHAPIILSYPGATLYRFDDQEIVETAVEETEHFRVTKSFLSDPERYFRRIFGDDRG
jgi:predicted ATPase